MMRIGVFGGTFDPPHMGHLIVASDACDALELDRMIFIPAADPPHKRGAVVAPPAIRLRMVRAAIAGDSRFEADDIELRRGGVSYTVDTLRELTRRNPGAELYFLVGADQVRQLHTWREPEEVSRLACLAVMDRGGERPTIEPRFRHRVVPVTRVDISASDIRSRLSAGRTVRYLLPEAVRGVAEGVYGGEG